MRELSDLVERRLGGNRLRMRLSAYVLAARLEAVAAAASVRLGAMSAGRYALEHADDDARGNRRGGLDLRVVDAWTGRDRAPRRSRAARRSSPASRSRSGSPTS